MAIPVNIDVLQQRHPVHTEIENKLSGPILRELRAKKWSTCATQLSYALNFGGAPIVNYDYEDASVAGGKVLALPDDLGWNYIYSVIDLKVYLDKRHGACEVLPASHAKNPMNAKSQATEKIQNRNGVLAFGYMHIDVWNGERIHQEAIMSSAIWTSDSVMLRGFFFWPVG